MQAIEAKLAAEIDARTIAGVVLGAANKSGTFHYLKAHGKHAIEGDEAMSVDNTMWIASCTKLMTAISVMQCVEKGLVTLDEDITRVLHEYKDAKILTGFEENGEPILEKAKTTITLRKLLTHTAGMSYESITPKLVKFREHLVAKGLNPKGNSVPDKMTLPLTYEPGTAWEYGAAIDWAGVAVERVSGISTLGEYMEKSIWGPLGMTSTTFVLADRPDIKEKFAATAARLPDGSLLPNPPLEGLVPPTHGGGAGSYSSAPDYLKIITAVLKNEGLLLKKETMLELFEPQIDAELIRKNILSEPMMARLAGVSEEMSFNWALGGLILTGDAPDGRTKGTLSWGGLPNLYWFVDPKKEVCGIYASQVLPPADEKSVELNHAFEQAVLKSA